MIVGQISVILYYTAFLSYLLALCGYFLRRNGLVDFFFLVGLLIHLISQLLRGWFLGVFTPGAIFEEIFFLPFILAFLAVINLFKQENMPGARSAILPVIFFVIIGALSPKGVFPPSPKSNTLFSPLFFLTEVIAHGCFILGGWFALRYLVFKERLPSFHSLLIWGFVFYSFAQIVGAIWCYLGWSSPLSWSPRHLQSAAIWCFYAAYLHLRFLPTWKLKNKAWFAVAGTVIVLWFGYTGFLWEMTMQIGV